MVLWLARLTGQAGSSVKGVNYKQEVEVMINYKDFKDLSAYKVSYEFSNLVWDIVMRWDSFARNTIGRQFVDATDSISANIAEGYGRYGKNDKIHFYRYSFGSLKESMSWMDKSYHRNLLSEDEYQAIKKLIDQLPMEINTLIKYTRDKLLK